jgi:hypothetical protein
LWFADPPTGVYGKIEPGDGAAVYIVIAVVGRVGDESPMPLRGAMSDANRESRDMDMHEHLGDGAPSYDG